MLKHLEATLNGVSTQCAEGQGERRESDSVSENVSALHVCVAECIEAHVILSPNLNRSKCDFFVFFPPFSLPPSLCPRIV